MKNLVAFLTINTILLLIGYGVYTLIRDKNLESTIATYEDCVRAGNPVMESSPPQCRTKGGLLFQATPTEIVMPTYDIRVTTPLPNETVKSPLTVSGVAPGEWFFEAVFPITLLDEDGTVLALVSAQAQGEWMTEELVPFRAELEFIPKGKRGILLLQKDNPSGLPQNDKKQEIPVQF
jgi:hypothetical protein